MSAKPNTPDPSATPEVVVENLRAAVHASEGDLAAQVVADSALDSKLLGLLGFFAIAGSILLTVPHGLSDRRGPCLRAPWRLRRGRDGVIGGVPQERLRGGCVQGAGVEKALS